MVIVLRKHHKYAIISIYQKGDRIEQELKGVDKERKRETGLM